MDNNQGRLTEKKERQERQIRKLQSELNLTDVQIKKIEDIYKDTYLQADAMTAQKDDLYKDARAKIENVFDTSQRIKWETRKDRIRLRSSASGAE
jgi:Spy/CpxP family protein refolding chaperone